jgi:hypothetical protein
LHCSKVNIETLSYHNAVAWLRVNIGAGEPIGWDMLNGQRKWSWSCEPYPSNYYWICFEDIDNLTKFEHHVNNVIKE